MDAKELVGPSQPNNSGITTVAQTIRKLQKKDETKNANDILSTMQAEDNTSIPFTMTEEEEHRLVNEMQQLAEHENKHIVVKASRFWLVSALHAREGDLKRDEELSRMTHGSKI